jgi:hypothetical protein
MTEELTRFLERYVGLWNETDAERRRKTIAELWAPDGANYTQSTQAVGHEAIETRVTRAYDAYVGSGRYRFRSVEPQAEHHNAVKLEWEMVSVTSGEVASVGLEFLLLDDDGRIISDHQFIVR